MRFFNLLQFGLVKCSDFDLPSNGDGWTDQVDGNEGDSTTPPPISTAGPSLASVDPPATLIYVCGGTVDYKLAFCEFPFTTLAGNVYTNSCADQDVDNPDIDTERPWCFVEGTEWGFCDCQAQLSFKAITTAVGNGLIQVTVQANLDHPGTVWCSLSAPTDPLPSLAQIQNATLSSQYAGAVGNISDVMIIASMNVGLTFSVPPNFTASKNYLACQASVPGIQIQPDPVGYILGATPTDSPAINNVDNSVKLITVTNGATIYSLMILVVLASFIGTRYALDLRKVMLFEWQAANVHN